MTLTDGSMRNSVGEFPTGQPHRALADSQPSRLDSEAERGDDFATLGVESRHLAVH